MSVSVLQKLQTAKKLRQRGGVASYSAKTFLYSSICCLFNIHITVTVNGMWSKLLSYCRQLCGFRVKFVTVLQSFGTNTKIPLREENKGAGATFFSHSLLFKTDTVPATNT